MSDFKLTQISNVMLGTTDLARSLTFYRDTLGLAVQFEMPGFVFLHAGGVTLSLSEAHAKLATPVADGTEVVFGVADVTAAHEALRARGVEFLNPPRATSPATSGRPIFATLTGTCSRSSGRRRPSRLPKTPACRLQALPWWAPESSAPLISSVES